MSISSGEALPRKLDSETTLRAVYFIPYFSADPSFHHPLSPLLVSFRICLVCLLNVNARVYGVIYPPSLFFPSAASRRSGVASANALALAPISTTIIFLG